MNDESKQSTPPDVEAIMARIRLQVQSELETSGTKTSRYIPPTGHAEGPSFKGGASPILYSDELNYLNAHWSNWLGSGEFSSHRPVIGKFIIRIKKFFRRVLVESLLKDYFEQERQFQAELVKHLNAAARYIDSRDAEVFWQLVQKIDNDVQGLNERTDRLFDEAIALTAGAREDLERRIEQSAERPAAPVGENAPEGALELIPGAEYLPARWRETIERINRNTRRLNAILSGGHLTAAASDERPRPALRAER